MSPRQVLLAALFAVVFCAELASAIGISQHLSKPALQRHHHRSEESVPAPPAVHEAAEKLLSSTSDASLSGWDKEQCVAILSAVFSTKKAAAAHHATTAAAHKTAMNSLRPNDFFTNMLSNTMELLKSVLATSDDKKNQRNTPRHTTAAPTGDYNSKIMKFIPSHVATVHPGGAPVKFSGPCFTEAEFSVDALDANGHTTVHLKVNKKSSLLCTEYFGLTNIRGCKLEQLLFTGSKSYSWQMPAQLTAEEKFALLSAGFMLFRFPYDPITIADHLLETVLAFTPLFEVVPDAGAVARNLDFLRGEQVAALPERVLSPAQQTAIDELNGDFIESGDVLGLLRLDGLDPLLAWAMGGSTLGHMTIALRDESDALHICESTTNSTYWPTNGLQCTPFPTWMKQVKACGQNVVHMPLSPEVRAKFNSKAAWKFVNASLNLDYGYGTILASWIDNLAVSYPPPLSPELHLLLPTFFSLAGANDIVNQIWTRYLRVRIGQPAAVPAGETVMNTVAALFRKNLTFGNAVFVPEKDGTLYEQKLNDGTPVMGRAMVCCVFVCSILKESGAFGPNPPFECEELTVPDLYQAQIYDTNFKRPAACAAADPDVPYCQLTGDYQIQLNQYSSVPMAHSFAHCPRGDAPDWIKPEDC